MSLAVAAREVIVAELELGEARWWDVPETLEPLAHAS
jgi:hypothetical protein